MPSDSNGVYSLPASYFVQNGDTVLPVQHNPPMEDMAQAHSNRVMKDGRTVWTGDMKAGGYRITGMGPGQADSDAATAGQIKRILRQFDTVAQLLADETLGYEGGIYGVVPGDVIGAEGFRYEVAAESSSDAHVETAGGVKLYALPDSDGFVSVDALGADRTGVTSSQAAFQMAVSNFDLIKGSEGNYVLTNTIIPGNRKTLRFAGSKDTTIWAGEACPFYTGTETFPSANNTPLIAPVAGYNNPDLNSYPVDKHLLVGVTLRGGVPVDANGIPNTDTGPVGFDATWTKDDIALEDVQFRGLKEGIYTRDSTRTDVVHWGLRVRGGGAMSCRRYAKVFPSIGSFDDIDVQGCYRGIDNSSSNANSSTLWITDARMEVNRNYPLDEFAFHIRLSQTKGYVRGYFEGSVRHILIEGENNSNTVIETGQYSRVNMPNSTTEFGVPIRYNVTGSRSTLTLIGIFGLAPTNMSAFIQLGGSAAGSIAWIGDNNADVNVFQQGSNFASTPFGLPYFNPKIRADIGGDLNTVGSATIRSGETFATNARLRVGQVDGIGTGVIGIETKATSTALRTHHSFRNGNGEVGSLQTSGNNTILNQTSDQTLKIDDGKISFEYAAEILRLITFHNFRWTTDRQSDHGVFAQELYEVYPLAVAKGGWFRQVPTGELDQDGNEISEQVECSEEDDGAIYVRWGVNYPKLIPIMGRVLQGVVEEQAALMERISALESKG